MDLEEIKLKLELNAKSFRETEERLLDPLTKEERLQVGSPVKTILTLDEFHANGHKYIIRQSLTIARFEIFENLQVDVGYGISFRNLFGNMRKAYDFLNAGQPADGAVTLHNVMSGIKDKIDAREPSILSLCALFICREDEDITTYDENVNKAKIEDWKAEGIAMENFFTLAFNLVNGFIPVYAEVSESISDHLEKVKDEIKRKPETRKTT